jgi:hypothetical protein
MVLLQPQWRTDMESAALGRRSLDRGRSAATGLAPPLDTDAAAAMAATVSAEADPDVEAVEVRPNDAPLVT